uniref:3-oxoacyl-[acyl-carrier-protein] reductase n=1 Tax=Saccoglossus kowalevskii TaxID=10224 RepID=A0ABM0MF94_SACKO
MAVQEGKRVALITGSTSVDGIGYGIAKALAQVGYDIILQGRRSVADIEPMREEIESSFKVTCHYLKADLLQRAEIESLCSNIRTIYPDGIDVLVNNACLYGLAAIEEYPVDNWDDVLKVNVTAPFDLIRLTLGAMKKKVTRYLTIKRMQWKFIPKRAPLYGGFWERLVGITKPAIKKVLQRSFVTCDELSTIVAEIEAVLNNRPITYVSGNADDLIALTPSHLINGRPITMLPSQPVDPDELQDPTFGDNQTEIQRRYLRLSELIQQFWRRWISEYLPALRERHMLTGKSTNTVKIGDIVLVHHDNQKRLHWNMAKVERLNYGRDGLVRSVDIKTPHGRTNRPISWGRIINISSILSKTTSPNLSAYVCSKHALDGLTK